MIRIMIILNRNSHKKLIMFTVYALIINFYITQINADDYKPNDYCASIKKSNQADWMSQLPDDVFINDLSIPGTHDSMAFWGNIGKEPPTPPGLTNDITKGQQRFNENGPDSLAKQLETGMRSIDIRVVFTKSKNKDDPIPPPQLAIHHGIIYEHANFLDVLRVAYNFLNQHPKETILMRLKLEKGSGKNSADFSSTNKADGGSSGSDDRDLGGYIVQWNGDNSVLKTAWLVGSDGYRRWIRDDSTFNCLKNVAGMKGPEVVSAESLDRYLNIKDCWAVCGAATMGTRSQLEIGTYLKSNNGARLTLAPNGLHAVDSRGNTRWAPPGKGNRLILQEDQNLVLYNGNQVVWASNTKDSGAIRLSIYDDGAYVLFNKDDKKIWSSVINPDEYSGKIVQWDGDNAQQKTSWLVGADGYRRWIHDWETYKCLKDVGWENSFSVSSGVLDKFPDLNNVWATCGADRIGWSSALEKKSYLRAGEYSLTLTNDDLVLAKKGEKIWSTGKGGAQLILQPDGNLVEYDSNRTPVWATATDGKKPGWLVLGDDGSLRLYDGDNNQVWSAGANIDPEKYRGKIVQWDGDNAQQKTSWLVGADGYRRWIHDWGTYKCLRDAGWEDSFSVSSGVLDKFPDLNNVWATCGADRIGPNSALERRSYLRAGEYSLTLTNDDLVLAKKGEKIWSTGKGGAQLILQPDGNLVEYDSNRTPVWATGTDGKLPGWLVLGDDGSLCLYDGDNYEVWSVGANIDPEKYRGKIVQWSGDNAQQKTSWLVGTDGYRRRIHDWETYKCLRDAGWEDSFSVSSGVLNKFPDLNNVWATCGVDRIGPSSALERRSYLKAGEYSLTLTNNDLVLAKKGEKIWSTGKGGAQLILQPDGNLVEYDSNRTPVWATGTDGKLPGWLVLGDDGSLRLYDANGKQIWSVT